MRNRRAAHFVSLAFVFALATEVAPPTAFAQSGATSEAPHVMKRRVEAIMKDVEEIRGRKFEKPIEAVNQSQSDFADYVDRELDRQMPFSRFEHYGKVVRKLGLHSGPEIEDFRGMAKLLMTSQAAAYYDPKTAKFYVLYSTLPPIFSGTLYSHELTHGLQDQHFDLDRFVMQQATEGLNDDELLARQAVVEGEASLVMTIWQMKSLTGKDPSDATLDAAVRVQASMNMDAIRRQTEASLDMISADEGAGDLRRSVEAMDDIPNFMLETMIGAYLKGMGFVHAVRKAGGWEKVDELYRDPPVSSEQILSPEKYLAGERPYSLKWQDFAEADVFEGWRLLETNALGELGWRLVFDEQGLPPRDATRAAHGWDGDAFAVLMNEADENDLILLAYTCWDDADEAAEFAEAYEKVAKAKYPNGEEPVDIGVQDKEVMIVEGAGENMVAGVRDFLMQTTKVKR